MQTQKSKPTKCTVFRQELQIVCI